MSIWNAIWGGRPLLTRRVPLAEQSSKRRLKPNRSALATIGVILIALIVLSLVFYAIDKAAEGRLILDMAVLFLGWVTGRATGEKAGASPDV